MAGPGFRTDNDTRFPDSTAAPDVKEHQQVHDKQAVVLNKFDVDLVPTDGQVLAWDAASGLWKPATVGSGSGSPVATSFTTAAAGSVFRILFTGSWPATRPTDRPDLFFDLMGGPAGSDPSWLLEGDRLIFPSTATTTGGVRTINGLSGLDITLTAEDIDDGPVHVMMTKAERDKLALARTTSVQLRFTDIVDANGVSLEARFGAIPTNPLVVLQYLAAGTQPAANAPSGVYAVDDTAAGGGTITTPAVVRVGMETRQSSSTQLTVPLPTKTDGTPASVPGDVAVFYYTHNPSDGGSPAVALPEYTHVPPGFTGKATQTISTTSRYEISAKELTAADISAGSVKPPALTSAQKMTGTVEVLRNVVGGLAGITAAITKDGATASATHLAPSLTFTGKVSARTTYAERRSGTATAGNYNGTGFVQDFWMAGSSSGSTMLAMATNPNLLTTSPAGGGTWTATAGGSYPTTDATTGVVTTNTTPAATNGAYTGLVLAASA
jgi:hypothetical protein